MSPTLGKEGSMATQVPIASITVPPAAFKFGELLKAAAVKSPPPPAK